MRGAAGLILVVEDEPRFRDPLEQLLRLRAFDVMTADSPDDALALVRARRPDAAIVDLGLIGGSGRDLIVRLPAGMPVIIFSGTREASGELERLRPRTRLIEKPSPLECVLDTLDELLRR